MVESAGKNTQKIRGVLVAALCVGVAAPVFALDPGESDPRKIMQAVEGRDDGNKRTSRLTLTVTDSGGRKLTRTVQARSMDFEGGTRSLMLFEAPADVRNTGLLSVDYDGAKDDDQWLYLPSLHRSTRISTSEKSGSFLGTDISYADMTSKNVDDYDYKLLEASEKVDGEDCWVIESRPRTKKEAEQTGYVKSQLWVSKAKLMITQAKNWVKDGRKLKYMKFADFKQVDGIWVAQKLSVRLVKGSKVESTTTLLTKDVRFNRESVKEEDFSQRRLEKGI